jgi:Uma2 family endonuclease
MGEPARAMSVEEYLALDTDPLVKYEYLNGVVVAMAGASLRHNVVAQNVARALGNALEARPCQVVGSDQRVYVAETASYVYPDITVVCEPPRLTGDRPRALTNPQLVIEVLSASTRDHDQGAKVRHYRKMPSVSEVLLIDANVRHAELYRRLETGQWLLTDVTGDGVIDLESVGVRLTLDEVYAKTDDLPFDPADEAPQRSSSGTRS